MGEKDEIDSGLKKILETTKNIRKETEVQERLGKKQEIKLNDISKQPNISMKEPKKLTVD